MRISEDVPAHLRDDVIVVDDFYRDPDAVRSLALAAEYRDFGAAANFPGRESVKAFGSPRHAELFARITGRPVLHDPRRWVFGKFRVAVARDAGRTRVHLDFVDWTAVVYLTPSAHAQGGLSFHRHLPTGLDRVPDGPGLARYGCGSKEEFDSRYVLADTRDAGAWETLHSVPMRYNRCVVFRGGRLFHGISRMFGDGLGDGRLTQNFFFMDHNGADGAGAPPADAEAGRA
jgi:hypothetical protein